MTIFEREWKCFAPCNDEFRVMQFNVLADGLAQTGDFTNCDGEDLDWASRWLLIKEEIARVDPDVLCVQEMNHIEDLARFMPDHFLLFCPKLSSPAQKCGAAPDGCAMLLRRSFYELIDVQIMYYRTDQSMNSGCIVVAAKDRRNQQGVVFATTHLKAKSGEANEELRCLQMQQLLARVHGSRSLLSAYLGEDSSSCKVLLLGDFNSPPGHDVYSMVYESELGFCSLYNSSRTGAHRPPAVCEAERQSAAQYAGSEPDFTTFKERSDGVKKHTIDYIWLSQHEKPLVLGALWELPSELAIGRLGLPCQRYPSDHLALAVKLGWRELL